MQRVIKLFVLSLLSALFVSANVYGQKHNAPTPTTPNIEPFAPVGQLTTPLIPATQNLEVGLGDQLLVSGNLAARSLTQGHSWLQTGGALLAVNSQIYTLVASPLAQDNFMLLGTNENSSSIWRSADGGITWQPTSLREDHNYPVTQIVFSPTYASDRTIFAIGQTGDNGVLWQSQNQGLNWQPLHIESTFQSINHIGIAPNFSTSHILIMTRKHDMVISHDGGSSWQTTQQGLNIPQGNTLNKIVFSPNFARDNTVFAVTYYGIYKSIDGGQSWTRYLPYAITDLKFHPQYGIGNQLFFVVALTKDDEDREVYVLFKTDDGGVTFTGLVGYVEDFEFSSQYLLNRTIYVTTKYGLLQTTDQGENWQYISIAPPPDTDPAGVVASPTFETDSTLFALFEYGGSTTGSYHQVWRTSDFGQTWHIVPIPKTDANVVLKLAASPNYAADHTLFIASSFNGELSLYKSSDGGEHWVYKGALPYTEGWWDRPKLAFSPSYSSDHTIYVSSDHADGLYMSSTDGASWNEIFSPTLSVQDFALAPDYPNDPRIFVLVGSDRLFRSFNQGTSWEELQAPFYTGLLTLSPNLKVDNTIFLTNVLSSGGGMWRSKDAGSSWEEIIPGFSTQQNATAISAQYGKDNTLIAHKAWGGVLWSEDGGDTFFELAGVDFGYYRGFVELPNWSKRPFPIAQADNGSVYFYNWPNKVTTSFECQTITLGANEPQIARTPIGVDSTLPVPWEVTINNNATWLTPKQSSGSLPTVPEFLIDSSNLDSPAKGQIQVDVYLSYRQKESFSVDAFVPCYTANLPTIHHK